MARHQAMPSWLLLIHTHLPRENTSKCILEVPLAELHRTADKYVRDNGLSNVEIKRALKIIEAFKEDEHSMFNTMPPTEPEWWEEAHGNVWPVSDYKLGH
jgi:hypothetical protein